MRSRLQNHQLRASPQMYLHLAVGYTRRSSCRVGPTEWRPELGGQALGFGVTLANEGGDFLFIEPRTIFPFLLFLRISAH